MRKPNIALRISVAGFLLIACLANTEAPVIRSDQFTLTFPPSWSRAPGGPPWVFRGPKGATATISVIGIDPVATPVERSAALERVHAAALEAFSSHFPASDWSEQIPLTTKQLDTGAQVTELLVTSTDALRYSAHLVTTNHDSVIVATVEGSARAVEEYSEPRSAIRGVQWHQFIDHR